MDSYKTLDQETNREISRTSLNLVTREYITSSIATMFYLTCRLGNFEVLARPLNAAGEPEHVGDEGAAAVASA